ACTCDIIREFSPDVLAVHPAAIDGARHASGVFSEIVDKSLEDTERWTGMIIDAVRDTGRFDDTDFVIMSDHGQLETKRIIHLNVILQENGLIDANEDGSFRNWDAFCKSAGHCVQVYLKNREDRSVYKKTYDLLRHMKDEGIYGFSEVFTEDEIRKKEHLGGDFAFVLESDGYTAFGNDWRRPLVRPHNLNDYKFGRATHGYLPDKGPQPTLIAAGPSFRKGVELDRRPIVDIAPTLAAVIRAEMNDTDGAVIKEILR
ncbi:MAG: alkaline phosphatase family protein, partial [Eubacteriales bacterium]|nr:alkaline phosphatase family protein [Eubacteriales bacterium]